MNRVIYDIRDDGNIQKIIDERSKYYSEPFYIEKYGRYGTSDWWDNLYSDKLVKVITGKIIKVILSGKSSIPVLEIDEDGERKLFTASGEEGIYREGKIVKLYLVEKDEIYIKKRGGELIIRAEHLADPIQS